ncbi:hypothetical protein O3P69_003537 [Scylla paramamosain]|uniref:UDP-glucuronosyltransferase n=1 Tax=Scylla paramamosain TaxID=85552 RepID=A0AAW0UIN1_SCYPA
MKVCVACVLAAALVWSVAGLLPPPQKTYSILMLLPYWGKSHRNVFMPLSEALADRGHKVVMLTMVPESSTHPNITEISFTLPNMTSLTSLSMFDFTTTSLRATYMPAMAREMYKVPLVKKLYKERKQFDLIVVDYTFGQVVYPFVHDVSYITIATMGMEPFLSGVMGNVLSPSYAPSLWSVYVGPLSFWQRLHNTFLHIWPSILWKYWTLMPGVQREVWQHFPDLPPLLDIERNQSLALMNSHFSITTPMPLLPSQVEVGAMHCRPAKPLPQDLEAWITGAGSAGVVYFSLGSIASGKSMPSQYRQVFLEAFRRLPQRVLWKYEGKLEGASDNVRVSSWLPQQDLLAHPSVKVFISHGGLLSLQESIFHVTPLLVLPIFGDQTRNGMFVDSSGVGRALMWKELTVDRIVDVLTDIITNPRYQENAARISASLRDQLTTPQERAVFWTEYVIRHRGAPQLRCPAAQLTWVEFLLLDMACLLLLVLLLLLLLIRRLLRAISAKLSGGYAKQKTT